MGRKEKTVQRKRRLAVSGVLKQTPVHLARLVDDYGEATEPTRFFSSIFYVVSVCLSPGSWGVSFHAGRPVKDTESICTAVRSMLEQPKHFVVIGVLLDDDDVCQQCFGRKQSDRSLSGRGGSAGSRRRNHVLDGLVGMIRLTRRFGRCSWVYVCHTAGLVEINIS